MRSDIELNIRAVSRGPNQTSSEKVQTSKASKPDNLIRTNVVRTMYNVLGTKALPAKGHHQIDSNFT